MEAVDTLIATIGLATFVILILVAVVLGLAIYLYNAFALYTIAKKTNTGPAWAMWIPIVNVFFVVQVAGFPWWAGFGFFLSVVPVFGQALALVFSGFVFWRVAEARNYDGWLGALMLIPVVNLVVIGILAWGKK